VIFKSVSIVDNFAKKINLVLHRKKPIVSDIGVAFDDDTEGKKRLSSSANGKKGKCLIDDDMM
jgi:hypothetical protein